MKFKKGVKIFGVRAEMALAAIVINEVYKKYLTENERTTITSGVEGLHSYASLHYVGSAFDLRTRDIGKERHHELAEELRESLTDEFDVVLKPTHIHIEFQPKRIEKRLLEV